MMMMSKNENQSTHVLNCEMGACKNMVIKTKSQREERRVDTINRALVKYITLMKAVREHPEIDLNFFSFLCQI